MTVQLRDGSLLGPAGTIAAKGDADPPLDDEQDTGQDGKEPASPKGAAPAAGADWRPELHPRDGHGRFAHLPGGGTPALHTPAQTQPGAWTGTSVTQMLADGETTRQFTARAAPAATRLFGPGTRQSWNGNVTPYPHGEKGQGVVAELTWHGTMNLQGSVAAQIAAAERDPHARVTDPSVFAVVLHELIHGVSPARGDRDEDRAAYQDRTVAKIEEGFTELGSIQHAPDFFDQAGVGGRETDTLAITDGKTVDNPDYARRQKALSDALLQTAQEARRRQGAGVASRLYDAAFDVKQGFTGHLDETIHQLAIAGDADLTGRARRLQQLADEFAGTRQSAGATLSEYARRLQNGARIRAGKAWGYYPSLTAAALVWGEEMAKLDGTFRQMDQPGSDGWLHVRGLTDEINREGAAGKVPAMARQVIARFSAAGEVPPTVERQVRRAILENWRPSPSGAENALYAAGQVVTDAEAKPPVITFKGAAAPPDGPATREGREAEALADWAWADPQHRAADALAKVNQLAAAAGPGALREVQDTARMIARLAGAVSQPGTSAAARQPEADGGTTAAQAAGAIAYAGDAAAAAVYERLHQAYPAGYRGAENEGAPGRDEDLTPAQLRTPMRQPYPELVDGRRAELRNGTGFGRSLAVPHEGVHVLVDGTHRAVARVLEGQRTVPVRVLDLP